MQKYDVLIVGAGMVGLTLALALAKQTNLTIALVDQLAKQPLPEQPEIRVSAINHASQRIFAKLDAWPAMQTMRLAPYQFMQVWESTTQAHFSFDHQTVNQPELGWIIENTVIRNALYQQAESLSNIHFINERLASVNQGDNEVFATFENAQTQPIIASLCVGADGANSWLRQQQNITLTFRDYDHHALVATVNCEQGHNNTAWQVFLPSGPLAFLPLPNSKQCSIVWSTSPEHAKSLSEMPAEAFSREITAASDGKLGLISLASNTATYPLTMRYAQNFVKDKVVLIGDAAHTIHPLAGQGVNLGLLDAAALAQTLIENHQQNKALSYSKTLNQFARWRKTEALEMIAAMESIKQLYSPLPLPLAHLRGIGMRLLDNLSPVKKLLINQALGDKSNLPELAVAE